MESKSTTGMQPELKLAVDKVIEALKSDPEYYRAWQANIAMAFQDEMAYIGLKGELIHKVANSAADNFLKLLIS